MTGTDSRKIPVAKPWMGDEEASAAGETIRKGWTTQGPEVAAFEREFADYVGSREACAVSNCTAGVALMLHSAGVGPGDEVITVSHSFIATVNPIILAGAIPVFVDIESTGFNIDVSKVESLVTEKTKAILAVHQLGMPCDIVKLEVIAQRHGLRLLEDAACAIGSEIQIGDAWNRIGRPVGWAASFSFHPRKILVTGDGGMITTNDSVLADRLRKLRQHGMSVSDLARHSAGKVLFEEYLEPGFNMRMTDIQAAVGRVQLRKLPAMIVRRREQAERYRQLLSEIPGLELPQEPEWARSNWQSYCVTLPSNVAQKEFMERLLAQGISTRRGVMCSHREKALAGRKWRVGGSGLARSETAQDRGIILPLYHEMTTEDQKYVADWIRRLLSTV